MLFFLERLLQLRGILSSKFIGPGDQRAVARDFVMLNGLSRGNHAGIENGKIFGFADHFPGFVDDPLERFAFCGRRLQAERLEDFV